ncbi:MAG: hypothetical protein ABIR84_08660, partial [Candidatus Nitrotoga sp.]
IYLNWRLWIYGIAFLMLGFIFAKLWRRAGVLTDAELTNARYSGKGVTLLRGFKAIYYGTVFNCMVLAMVLVAAGRIAEVFLPWHLWLPANIYSALSSITEFLGFTLGQSLTGLDPLIYNTNITISILILVSFTLFYSTTGGLRAVVATDVVQFALAMTGTLLFAIFVWVEADVSVNFAQRLNEVYSSHQTAEFLSFSPPEGSLFWPFIVLVSVQWFFQINSDGTGYLAQRMMACKSNRDARIASLIFAWSQVFFRSILWIVIGVGLLLIYPFNQADLAAPGFVAWRESTYIQGIQDFLPMGVKGLMLVGMLGALASTIDTHLNWGASYWSNDLYKHILCEKIIKRQVSNREIVWVARLSNIFILLIGLVIMTHLGSIQTAWTITLLFGSGMGSVLVMRWLWERVNLFSEVAAMAVSLVAATSLILWGDSIAEYVQVVLVGFLSTAAVIVTTLLTQPTSPEKLKEFFLKVQPKGFWGKTALACGVDPAVSRRELWFGIQNTALAALTLFLCVVGVASLIVQNPNQPMIFAALEVFVGLAIAPLWYRHI